MLLNSFVNMAFNIIYLLALCLDQHIKVKSNINNFYIIKCALIFTSNFYKYIIIYNDFWNYKLENQESETEISGHCTLLDNATSLCAGLLPSALWEEEFDRRNSFLFSLTCVLPLLKSFLVLQGNILLQGQQQHNPQVFMTFCNSCLLLQGHNARDRDKYFLMPEQS